MSIRKWLSTTGQLIKENLVPIFLFVAILCLLVYGLKGTQASSAQEELRMVEESITRAMVSCYAIEGVYPQSYEYLQENYNLLVDESKYLVKYTAFASNIMPEVTVLEVNP